MFVIPTVAIISPLEESQIQPNAIDITCDQIFSFNKQNITNGIINQMILLKEGKTQHAERRPVLTQLQYHAEGKTEDRDDNWYLNSGAYPFESNTEVEIPDGHVGWLITRSSLNRNGVIVHSGLYDSGFKGNIGGTLYVMGTPLITIQRGARIAQFVLAKAESVGHYNGQYQKST